MKIDTRKMCIAMARKCMSNQDLADAVECSIESIHQILRGSRNVPTKKLGKIAKALEVDPEELLIN